MEPLKVYHIYNHANGFENLFNSEENYRYFLRRYEHFISPVADTLAYCLMPNHIHFLLRIKSEDDIIRNLEDFKKKEDSVRNLEGFKKDSVRNLEGFTNLRGLGGEGEMEKRISKQFSNLFNSYAKAFNKMYNRRGSLFVSNFKRKEVSDDSYFTHVIHYIHANPVHHGFTSTIPDWPWSSYSDVVEEISSMVRHEEIISWFGSKAEFIKFHQRPVDVRTRMKMDR